MKEEREVVVIACRPSMAGSGALPSSAHSPAQLPLPTPSPFSFSVASTRWSSRPSIYISSIFLRFLALLFSFAASLSLAAPSRKKAKGEEVSSFTENPELLEGKKSKPVGYRLSQS
ncbi:hypothetical protein Acr_00g0027390 [Actinidia rufa]|uniref:Uncharacterized protein n=1 Tax=Actinidia rufa TaxID=165716 RepID=A0A7J0DDX7_9ERIC|nr:hypothetical protein Acr_00g0027390 [Actinidia rufa]